MLPVIFNQLPLILLITTPLTSSYRLIQIRPVLVNNTIKLFFSPQVTVSKFPPIIEFFVQRIQAQFSNYVHEDLSRPPTWDKPVYTLSPAEQATMYDPAPTTSGYFKENVTTTTTTTTEKMEFVYEELEETTEKFFEIISTTSGYNQDRNSTSADGEFEYEELEEVGGTFIETSTNRRK